MTDIKSMNLKELQEWLAAHNEPKYRADQIFKWIHGGARGFVEMTNIPKTTRKMLDENAYITAAECVRRQISKKDGTIKYLFRFADNNCVESVFMKYIHGKSVCISTQAGCRMGCKFCASAIGGLCRNLTPAEMLEQVMGIIRDTREKISNIVLMGTGEPLDNYDNVLKFIRLVNHEKSLNIGMRHISLSTCGLCDRIYELAREKLPITLSISLHAPDDETRNKIMPINKKHGVNELIDACRYYYSQTSRRITFEYALISGLTDTDRAASRLIKLLGGFPCHINLIMLNKTERAELNSSTCNTAQRFKSILEKNGLNATIRRSLGDDISAACGQLRRSVTAD